MISVKRVRHEQILKLTGGIPSDNDFDFEERASSPLRNEIVLGHFENDQPFGFTLLSLCGGDEEPTIVIDIVWNRPSHRGMGMGAALVTPVCDKIAEIVGERSPITLRAEAISRGGMRFCKDVAYDLGARGVVDDAQIGDMIEYARGDAELGEFSMRFSSYPGSVPASSTEMATFLLEQSWRDIWCEGYEARSVRTALRKVCVEVLREGIPDEDDLADISKDALMKSLRSQHEAEFCVTAKDVMLEGSIEEALEPRF